MRKEKVAKKEEKARSRKRYKKPVLRRVNINIAPVGFTAPSIT